MPVNDGQARRPPPKAPAREPSEEVLNEFAELFVKEFQLVKTKLEEKSPGQSGELLQDLMRLPKQEFVQTVLDTADEIKIDTMEKADPKFNRANTFIRSLGNTAFLGAPEKVAALLEASFSDKNVSEIIREEGERSRLMSKAFPGVSVTGLLVGFLGPSPAGKVFGAGARGGIELTKKLSSAFVSKLGTDPKFASRVGSLIDNALTRGAAAGGAGAAAFTATKGAVELAADTALGATKPEEVPSAIVELAKRTGQSAEEGALFGAGFAATGMAAAQAARAGKALFRKGAKLLGKDLKYQTENLELVREVMESTPELVIAESAEKMAPALAREQAKLKAIETAAKNEITQAIGNRKIELSKEFQATADELASRVNELRQTGETGIARAATKLNESVGKAFTRLNREYGAKWDAVVKNAEGRVSLEKPLELVEGILRKNGALNRAGKIQPGVQWAKDQPELFSSLTDLWKELGGELKAQGGGAVSKSLADAVSLQRRIGELADFGRSGGKNYFGRVHRDLYFKLRDEAEAIAPDLKPLNRGYSGDRGKIDDFREVLGKNERSIAVKLQRDLLNNRNTFVREAIEGFSGLSEETAAAAGEGAEISRRLQIVNGFKKNPKGVFGQLRQAYLQNDTLTLSALERIAAENPGLKTYLETAKRQAQVLAELPKPGAGARSVTDPEVGRIVEQAVPGARPAIERAQGARAQSAELERVLPQDRLQLEQRLSSQGFAPEGTLEARVAQNAAAGSPELTEPLKRAEAARVAQRLKTGKGMEKSALEELPILGDTLFALRKMATPTASRLLNVLGKAKSKTRSSLISDIWDELEGTQALSKASLSRLPQQVGPEAALVIYAQQPGGAEDIIRAAEKTGIALSGDDDREREQNRPR